MYDRDIIYHVFNQGNNRQTTFFSPENYEYFLRKVKQLIIPHASFFAYCLMPNRFHFLLKSKDRGMELGRSPKLPSSNTELHREPRMQLLSQGFRSLLSSYTQAINRQEGRIGSLWRSKTKIKPGWGADSVLE